MKTREPETHLNLMLAVVLSMAVLFAWQFFYAEPRLKEQQARQKQAAETAERQKAEGAPQSAQPSAAPGAALPATGTQGVVDRGAALAKSARVPVDTPSLKGSISLEGGRIDDLSLVKHRETINPDSPNVILFSPLGAKGAYFAEHGWQAAPGSQAKTPGSDTVWRLESGAALTPSSPVVLSWDNGEGLVFRRTVSVDGDYMFTVADAVENKTAGEATLTPYARIYRFGVPKIEGFIIQHEGLIGVPGDAGLKEITYAGALEDGTKNQFAGKTGGWAGFTDKYWASALVPPQDKPYAASFNGGPASGGNPDVFWTETTLAPVTAAAGATATVESRLFAGAKQVKIINGYEETFGIERFGWIVDWGYFYFFTKPLFYLIDWLYGLFGNFGVAMLAVTVIVKAVFFPLANKSYESMAKMKKLQPEMEKLRERFKDDKARQQQELMKLYQAQKINPLAGCLPVLLQIPVFFALYKVLYISIDMRHAPFVGWIRDLSAPDPTNVFNLFGLLPFTPPEYLHLGIWPLIMGVTMWLQMQLNPPQPDPTQQMIFNWMPVMFTFLLGTFPAGLVIYWTWNNILSILQQGYIMKKQGAEVALGANIKKTFGPLWSGARGAAKTVSAKTGLGKVKDAAPPSPSGRVAIEAAPVANAAPLNGEAAPIGLDAPSAQENPSSVETPPPPAPAPAKSRDGAMTRDQALSALGLRQGATRREIEAAYRRLVKRSEPGPDRAARPELSMRADAARSALLRNGRA